MNHISKNTSHRPMNCLTLGAAALILSQFHLPTAAAAATGAQAAEGRPNIVLVLADDMTWNDLGCMGSPTVKTPNLDRIAAQGAVFDRLYTCTSVCTPTRF